MQRRAVLSREFAGEPGTSRDLGDAIEDFIRFYTVRKGWAAPRTKDYFGRPLRSIFLPWARERGAVTVADIDQATTDDFTIYLQQRITAKGTPLAKASQLAYLKALKYFLQWASERGEDVKPEEVGLPRLRKVEKDVLSEGEMQALEDAAGSERDKLLVRIMVETGARVGEVANLRKDDILMRERRYPFLRFSGKTGDRFSPISAQLHRRLTAYAAGKSGRRRSTSAMLFVADRKRAASSEIEPITASGIYQAIRDAAKRAEHIHRPVHPHLLRASAITRMCSKGMNAAVVSQITGVSMQVISMHYAFPSASQSWEAAMKALGDS